LYTSSIEDRLGSMITMLDVGSELIRRTIIALMSCVFPEPVPPTTRRDVHISVRERSKGVPVCMPAQTPSALRSPVAVPTGTRVVRSQAQRASMDRAMAID